jgi:predicted PurR-regulated permease PerM
MMPIRSPAPEPVSVRDPAAPEPAPVREAAPVSRQNGWRAVNIYLLTAAAFVIVVAGMRASAGILVPFLLAIFVAVICAPLYQAMTRRHVPASLAIVGILLVMSAAVLGMAGVLERTINSIAGRLPRYQAALFGQLDEMRRWLEDFGVDLPEATLREYFDPQWLLRYLGTVASTLGDLLTTTFIIVIVAIFILLEGSALPDKIRQAQGLSPAAWTRLRQIVADVRRYMFLKTVMSLLTGVLIALWCLLFGIEFPILLGLLSFALNYIPTIGSIVAALPGILLALIQFGLGTAVLTTVAYVVINIGVSNGIEPRYLGNGLGLSPLVVILSVLFWGWVLGAWGMLLAVPLTTTVKIALESSDDTRWIAVLMSERPRRRARLGAGRTAAAKPRANAS